MEIEMTLLDWVEKCGIENMKDHVSNADIIQKQASTLLTLLLSGAGAALYFGMQHEEFRLAALAVSFWLFAVAAFLTLKCLMFGDFPSVWNEPKNLNQPDYGLDELREFELLNLQGRIKQAVAINFTKSVRLNRCILATCFTPVIALIAWGFLAYDFFS